jgi:H+/Cl- antiporter ClcA
VTQPAPRRQTTPPVTEPQPLPVSTARVVAWGIAAWAVALVVTLAVPALHAGERDWWPWTCVAGIVLGFIGYTYVRRGRGNAEDAH